MKAIYNKKAQLLGSTVTAAVATVAIAVVILVFALVSPLFSAKSDLIQNAQSFSFKGESRIALFSILQYQTENRTVSDLIRISAVNSSYATNIANSLSSLNQIYPGWHLQTPQISLGEYYFTKDTINAKIPDSENTIQIIFEVSKK